LTSEADPQLVRPQSGELSGEHVKQESLANAKVRTTYMHATTVHV